MASPNLSEIVTTTMRKRSGMLADNVTQNNAILYRLQERGKIKPVSGGRTIVEELFYQENSTYKRYSGYETLNIAPSDVITAAEFEWKQAAVAISISGLEELQNSDGEAIIDLLEARIENAEDTMANNLATDLYSDGSSSGGKQIGGLQLLVADTGQSTAGGINSATWTFWRNQVYDFSDEGAGASANTIQTAMNTLWLACKRNRDRTDLILADDTYYQYYWSSLQQIQRITNEKMAAAGFENLKFMGADVIPDGAQGGSCPSAHMYFLNTKYICWRPHSQRNMVPLDKGRYSVNQDAMVKIIVFAGNMTARNRALQGCMVA